MPSTTTETAKKLEESDSAKKNSTWSTSTQIRKSCTSKNKEVCIAKSNMAYVIGVFSTSKKMKFDGKEENQNPGMCNKVVEELQEYLISLNY